MEIHLTTEQANQLLQLIDVAVKAGGVANARAAIPLVDLILAAAQKPKPE
jgi:hypothetical protein